MEYIGVKLERVKDIPKEAKDIIREYESRSHAKLPEDTFVLRFDSTGSQEATRACGCHCGENCPGDCAGSGGGGPC
jgi:hypothetical protein